MDWEELNLTKICRCCKRNESGMTSIFDGNEHSTYPPVDEMLRSIVSLNIQENDGLPSLVCTLCLNNIQDAYTFILQLIQIDEELSQMIARRKQADNLPQLPQSTNATNQFTSTDFVKKENEDVEDLDEPMQNYYQHESADNSYENIDFVVKLEQGLDAAVVDEPEVKNEKISNLSDPLYHAPDESSSHDDLLMVQNPVDMADFEDIDEMGVDEDYQVDVEDGPKLRAKQRKSTTNTVDVSLLKCKVCAYTCAYMSSLKRHLQTHSKIKQSFACSKCNRTFSRRDNMVSHCRNCDGKLSKFANVQKKGNASKQVLALTHQDLEDPLKIKKYYTEVDVQKNDDNDVEEAESVDDDEVMKIEETSTLTVYKCRMCAFTNGYMSNLKRHLQTHTINKPFTCSKCNDSFSRNDYLQRHWGNCNGEISKYGSHMRQKGKHVLIMTQEDLEDPVKLRNFYTEIDVQNNDDDIVKMHRAEDGGDDVEIEDSATLTVFKCKLCGYSNGYKSNLKRHLLTHSKNKPEFICSKCNGTFTRKDYMLRHWRNCKGEMSRYATGRKKGKALKQVEESLTLQELEDPLKMMNYYTVTEIEVQNKDDDEQSAKS